MSIQASGRAAPLGKGLAAEGPSRRPRGRLPGLWENIPQTATCVERYH